MKNRRIFCLLLIALFVSLCGCNGYKEADNGYIVTAIGFDGEDDIAVSVEVVSAGGSERSDKPNSEIIKATGKTPMEAVFALNNQISKNLLFDHCTAIIIGRNLSENHLEDVFRYGNELKELNFAVDMFVCENAGELLDKSKSVSVSRGFDITANLKETNAEIGVDYKNKFYEVYSAYKSGEKYNFPFLKVDNDRIVIDGQCVYKEKKEIASLDNKEAILYSFITNNNDGGKIYIGKEFADISVSRCKLGKDMRYKLKISVKKESENFKKTFVDACEKMLADNMRELGFSSDRVTLKERRGI